MATLTQLIFAWRNGDSAAETDLFRHVYPIMKEIAYKHLRATKQQTLRPTELANDVLMQIRAGEAGFDFANSAQFYTLSARMIRCLIVDHVRDVKAMKRGRDYELVELDFGKEVAADQQNQTDWMALDQALTALELEDQSHARLVELRYFMGLSIREAAEAMSLSTATADRKWRYARAFLAARMSDA
jgi:RNA polymerase sigma factor (TIGR02999 family)